jgi:hypothetical protein
MKNAFQTPSSEGVFALTDDLNAPISERKNRPENVYIFSSERLQIPEECVMM